MSMLLFMVGAIAALVGAVMVGFGIPINEFSFGNTLITSGATVFMGGLIILALGAVVAQLQRVAEALAVRPPMRAARPAEPFEQPASRGTPAVGRVPFPPKPKAEIREQRPAELQLEPPPQGSGNEPALSAMPSLRNPDEIAVEETDDLSLSPRQQPLFARPPVAKPIIEGFKEPPYSPFSGSPSGNEKRQQPALDTSWRASFPPAAKQSQNAFFETMWPAAEPRSPKIPASEARFEDRVEPRSEPKIEPTAEPKPELQPEPLLSEPVQIMPAEPETPGPAPQSEVRAVAILKSGVVDGMGYTLYVDGSIEAELPQGTIRFASINELRSHLEKAS